MIHLMVILQIYLKEKILIKHCVMKDLILLKIQSMMDLALIVHEFFEFYENFADTSTHTAIRINSEKSKLKLMN